MLINLRLGAFALAFAAAVSAPATAQGPLRPNPFKPVVVAEYPPGTFLENLEELKNGDVVFTSYFAKTIEILEKSTGKTRTFATLSAHPVAILSLPDGFIVSAHGAPFTSGPKFTETMRFLLLDKAGKETASFAAPEARFLNGMAWGARGAVLVADSIAATIWQVDPKTRKITAWLKDEAFSQDPAVKEFKPGANGIKRRGSTVYVSNSSRGTLSSIKLGFLGRVGKPQLVAKVGAIDDFAIAGNRGFIFTTHGDQLRRLRKNGSVADIMTRGCDGCTAVAITGRINSQLLILTTGGLSEGRKEPARVLRLPYR